MYASNSPVRYADPLGLFRVDDKDVADSFSIYPSCLQRRIVRGKRIEEGCCGITLPSSVMRRFGDHRSKFIMSRKEFGNVFYQEVSTEAALTCGCAQSGTCGPGSASSLCCSTVSIRVSEDFVEAFSPITRFGSLFDSHGVSPLRLKSVAEDACGMQCDPCCPWSFRVRRTKRLTVGRPDKTMDHTRKPWKWRSLNSAAISHLDCSECGSTPSQLPAFPGLYYPTGHILIPQLAFPAGSKVMTSRARFSLSAGNCGTVWTAAWTWTPYS